MAVSFLATELQYSALMNTNYESARNISMELQRKVHFVCSCIASKKKNHKSDTKKNLQQIALYAYEKLCID